MRSVWHPSINGFDQTGGIRHSQQRGKVPHPEGMPCGSNIGAQAVWRSHTLAYPHRVWGTVKTCAIIALRHAASRNEECIKIGSNWLANWQTTPTQTCQKISL